MISVIVPTFNETAIIGEALARLAAEQGMEVIVADGQSEDGTAAIARESGVKVVEAERGRAAQMNAGAKSARGEVLLFLHADTKVPQGFAGAVNDAMRAGRVVGGAFSFALEDESFAARVVERGANFRSRFLRLPYGDQGIFVRREAFEAAGGFPEWPVMEEAGLLRELKRRGKLRILAQEAVSSARRYRRMGYLKTTLFHLVSAMAFAVGISPKTIHRCLVKLGYYK